MARINYKAALLGAAIVACGQAGGLPEAVAQSAASEQQAQFKFDIQSQPLNAALRAFAEITGLQLSYTAELVRNISSANVSGEMSANAALERLLAGTGLNYRFVRPRVVTIERATAERGAKVLGAVRVEGADESGVAGINGSTDATATEGTGSYTSSALTIGSKRPQSIKDTPQSVSVITQQRMQDQNLTDFSSALDQATGITLVSGGRSGTGSNLETAIYSRGFEVRNVQIDGGAPLSINGDYGYFPLIDMAMYDHVELLRGADGLRNGYGDPGGVVNLTRKRPLDHAQVVLEAQAGSWDHYRVTVDTSTPLGFGDRLRGRAVVSYQDQGYFYDTADNRHSLVYGILETDVTPSTLLSAGASFTRRDALPWVAGLPRYQDGADLRLSRDTCLCASWSRWSFQTDEIFLQLTQNLGERWLAKVNLTRSDQSSEQKYGAVAGAVRPVDGGGPRLLGGMFDYESKQTLADATLDGAFELFGREHEIVIGANYQKAEGGGYTVYAPLYSYSASPLVDVFDFDPAAAAFVEPAATNATQRYPARGQKQWGAYADLRLSLLDRLKLVSGIRYSHYEYLAFQREWSSAGSPVDGLPFRYTGHNLSWPPMYSLVYEITPQWSVYGSYADIYVSQATKLTLTGDPVEPITGSNIEGGVKWQATDGRLNAALAFYRVEQQNFAMFVGYGDYGDSFGNTGDAVHFCCYNNDSNAVNFSEGLDLEITGELAPGWQLFAGYTFNSTEIRGSQSGDDRGKPLVSRAPEHLLKLWTSYRFPERSALRRLTVSAGVNAQTSSYNSGSACSGYEHSVDENGEETATCLGFVDYDFTQGSYAVFSGRVAYQLNDRWNAALNVDNVTDRTYYQTAGTIGSGNWYGEPRSFTLSLRGTF